MKLLLVQVRYGIGDIILAGLPYIHALSKKFNSKISLLVKESSRASDLFADDDHVDEIITLKNDMDGVRGIFKLTKELKKRNFDNALTYGHLSSENFISAVYNKFKEKSFRVEKDIRNEKIVRMAV